MLHFLCVVYLDQNKADGGETVTGERVMNKEKAMRIAQLTLAVSGFKDSVTYDDVTALFGRVLPLSMLGPSSDL